MSITKDDLKYNVIITNKGSNYAYQLLDCVWVTIAGKDVMYWVAQPGNVRTGDFVPSTDAEAVTLFTEKYLTESFDKVWKKDDRFKDGDILTTADGKITFLYRKVNGAEKVWKLGGEQVWQSSLASREADYGTLKKVQRGWSGESANFSNTQ